MLLGPALVLFALWLACVVLGIHGLLLGRLPGRWLPRHVTQPRVWGSGALLLAVGGLSSPSLAVIGIGLVALGHVMKPTP
ncbi:MAG TPA: hypothetical protein VGL02_10960 [Streptomyces sp.]